MIFASVLIGGKLAFVVANNGCQRDDNTVRTDVPRESCEGGAELQCGIKQNPKVQRDIRRTSLLALSTMYRTRPRTSRAKELGWQSEADLGGPPSPDAAPMPFPAKVVILCAAVALLSLRMTLLP